LTTASQLPQKLGNDLWPHAALLVTSLENTIVDQKGSTPHFILTGTHPNWVKNLRTFGEIGIVYTKPTKIRNKLEKRGNPCMFIGYAEDHTSNMFKLNNPKTYAVILSRNVYWLNKSYGEFYKVRPTASPCQIRHAHRNMEEVTYVLPDRKDPPSNTVARALFQPPKPDELPHPNFDNDNASIPPDASPPTSPEHETLDTATTTDEPYSWTRIPRVSGISRIARESNTSYNPSPLASTSSTLSEASADSS
jgi:hypothetical protein